LHLVRGLYRWRFLIKARREVNIQLFILAWLDAIKPKGSLRINVDIDPYSFL
jgi:primosomal protein N' (replication factor Y) (superfamily II helicase)